jgi:hypothetical protein
MQTVQEIRYRGIAASPELRASVEHHAARIARFHERVAACRVALERWYQHHGQGSSYRVEIDMELAGEELTVARESALGVPREALESTLSAAFDQAESALEQRAASGSCAVPHVQQPSERARRLHALHGRAPEDEQQAAATHDW